MDDVHKKWAEMEIPTTSAGKDKEDEAKIAAERKKIIKIVNWDLNDDKHRKTENIKDTVTYLRRILENVRDNPTEEKFRKVSEATTMAGRQEQFNSFYFLLSTLMYSLLTLYLPTFHCR